MKSLSTGTMTVAATPARAQPGEASGGPLAFSVVLSRDDEVRGAGRRRERAEASGRERGGGDFRYGGDERQHGLDALADGGRRAHASTGTMSPRR